LCGTREQIVAVLFQVESQKEFEILIIEIAKPTKKLLPFIKAPQNLGYMDGLERHSSLASFDH
jgi:hypothetical protein